MPRNQRPCLSEQNPFDPSAAHEQTLEVSDHDLRHKKNMPVDSNPSEYTKSMLC